MVGIQLYNWNELKELRKAYHDLKGTQTQSMPIDCIDDILTSLAFALLVDESLGLLNFINSSYKLDDNHYQKLWDMLEGLQNQKGKE